MKFIILMFVVLPSMASAKPCEWRGMGDIPHSQTFLKGTSDFKLGDCGWKCTVKIECAPNAETATLDCRRDALFVSTTATTIWLPGEPEAYLQGMATLRLSGKSGGDKDLVHISVGRDRKR